MWYFGTSTGESKTMGTFGWVLMAGAFLILIMVANNSWPWVWAKISAGMPQPGQGNPIVPTPPEGQQPFSLTPAPDIPLTPTNNVPSGNTTVPPTVTVNTTNGVVQSITGPNGMA